MSHPRSLKKAVPCSRCAEPLYYPSTLDRRKAVLCCGRCGAQTRVPSILIRVLKVAWFVLFIAAVALLVFIAQRY